MAKKYKFRLVVGRHADLQNGKCYIASAQWENLTALQKAETQNDGDIVESDVDLRVSFPNKFELVYEGGEPPAPSRPDIALTTEQKVKKSKAEALSPVTDQFPTAGKADVTVVKKGKLYYVYDAAGDLLNEDDNLKNKKAVEKFIDQFIDEDDDEGNDE